MTRYEVWYKIRKGCPKRTVNKILKKAPELEEPLRDPDTFVDADNIKEAKQKALEKLWEHRDCIIVSDIHREAAFYTMIRKDLSRKTARGNK